MDELVLYDYPRSSASYRVRIALEVKGLKAKQVPVNLLANEHHSAEHLARNPAGRVPVLVHGQVVLTQSLAILEYLEEAFPESTRILPQDTAQRARARSLAQTIACDIHPLNNLAVLRYLTGPGGFDDAQKLAWYQHWIASGFAALEAMLDGATRFCVGDTPTLADICLVPQVYNARRFDCALQAYPCLMAIAQHCETLPAFAAAAP